MSDLSLCLDSVVSQILVHFKVKVVESIFLTVLLHSGTKIKCIN